MSDWTAKQHDDDPQLALQAPDDDSMRAAARPRVLMLTHRVPWPLDRGDRIRAYHILKRLAVDFDVALACVSDEPVTDQQRQAVGQLAQAGLSIRPINARYGKARAIASLLAGKAGTPAYFYRADLARQISRWHLDQPFDAVFTYCTAMIGYARRLMWLSRRNDTHTPPPRHIIDLVDVDSAKWADYARTARAPMKWVYAAEADCLRCIEAGLEDHLDAVAVVSDAEADLYRKDVGHHLGLTVIRHAVDADAFTPMNDVADDTLVFTGTLDYRPNVEGVCWFARNIMPKLRQQCRRATLRIVGRRPTREVQALNEIEGVEVVGPVDDVRQQIAQAAVVIAPLLRARGVQSKVLEAMACAKPVVCSPAAFEGILADEDAHLLVARDDQAWVQKLVTLLGDTGLRKRLGAAARQRIETHYQWSNCLADLPALVLPWHEMHLGDDVSHSFTTEHRESGDQRDQRTADTQPPHAIAA